MRISRKTISIYFPTKPFSSSEFPERLFSRFPAAQFYTAKITKAIATATKAMAKAKIGTEIKMYVP